MIPLKKGSTPQTTNSVSPIRTVFNVRTWPLQWMAVATVLTSIALAYGNSVKAPFLFDDSVAIVDNQTIRHLVSLAVLVPPTDGSTTTGRPVVNLSFALNYAISGEQTWSYHVLNITIHALAALTLMGIVLRTLSSNT